MVLNEFDALEKDAIARDIPIMQKEGLMYMIDLLIDHKASSVLEVGSAIGYSSMMMARYVPGLKVDTIERDEDRYKEAIQNIQDHELSDQIDVYFEDALVLDPECLKNAPYDCIFIDGAKAQYRKFFEKYAPLLKKGGFVLVDNLDFHGMIFDIEHIKNRNTRALVRKIKRFKDWIMDNDNYHAEYIEIGDGLCVITGKDDQ